MKVKAVIFDLFGTLVNAFGAAAGSMGGELATALAAPQEPFIQLWNQTLEMRIVGEFDTLEANVEYVCDRIGVHPKAEQLQAAVEIRLNYVRRALKPTPNAIETANQLKNRGYSIGLISNCSPEIAIIWPETPFAKVIDVPIFSCRARLKKPDRRIYHRACEKLGVAPDSCLYIGDGEDQELTAAAQVGLHPVLIRTSSQNISGESHRDAREWQGTTISNLTDVLRLVDG
jgi:putative hydrolase of the HAD superfamily